MVLWSDLDSAKSQYMIGAGPENLHLHMTPKADVQCDASLNWLCNGASKNITYISVTAFVTDLFRLDGVYFPHNSSFES